MEALHKAEEILEEANEAAREQENAIKLEEISKLIDLETLEEVFINKHIHLLLYFPIHYIFAFNRFYMLRHN